MDHLRLPLGTIQPHKLQQIQTCVCTPRLYLSIEDFAEDPRVKAIVWDIEVGIQCGAHAIAHRVQRRYSELRTFDEKIRIAFGGAAGLASFPPRKLIGNMSPTFLEERKVLLQTYLSSLVRVPGLTQCPAFCLTFEMCDV